MSAHLNDLKNALSRHVKEADYTPGQNDNVDQAIRQIASMVREMGVGDYTLDEVLAAASRLFPDFDMRGWFMRWESEGVYDFQGTLSDDQDDPS